MSAPPVTFGLAVWVVILGCVGALFLAALQAVHSKGPVPIVQPTSTVIP